MISKKERNKLNRKLLSEQQDCNKSWASTFSTLPSHFPFKFLVFVVCVWVRKCNLI